MIFAYVTNDEGNRALALQFADKCRVALCCLAACETPPTGKFDALLFDWDSLPLRGRLQIQMECLADSSLGATAVHGPGLSKDECEALHQDGIAAFRSLDTKVFMALRHLVRRQSRVFQASRSAHHRHHSRRFCNTMY
jgi:hypothetical protein